MIYVGDEGIYAAWYSFYHGVLPEIAWIKSGYGKDVKARRSTDYQRQGRDNIPQVVIDELITQLEMTYLNIRDKAELLDMTTASYHQYKSRLKRRRQSE